MSERIRSRVDLYVETRRVYDRAASGMGGWSYEVRELSEYLHKIWTDLSEPERAQVNEKMKREAA